MEALSMPDSDRNPTRISMNVKISGALKFARKAAERQLKKPVLKFCSAYEKKALNFPVNIAVLLFQSTIMPFTF
jgi:hypothetical protein